MNRRFWISWGWLSWILPAAFLLARAFIGGGWEALILAIFSPVIVAVTGLLGWLPRRILKSRGFTTAPTVFVILLTVYWSVIGWWLLSLRPVGDSATSAPSIIRSVVPMSARQEDYVQYFSMLLGVLSCLTATLLAVTVKEPNADATGKPARPRRGGLAFACALVLTPAVILGSSALAEIVALHGPSDTAGNQQADALNMTEEAVRALHEERWQAIQEQLVPLRERLATEGWNPAGTKVPDNFTYGHMPPTYAIEVVWHAPLDTTDLSTAAALVEEALAATGWTIEDASTGVLTATSSDGIHLRVQVYGPNESSDTVTVRFDAETPEYWREQNRPTWAPINPDDYGIPNFRFDQWPKLRPRASA